MRDHVASCLVRGSVRLTRDLIRVWGCPNGLFHPCARVLWDGRRVSVAVLVVVVLLVVVLVVVVVLAKVQNYLKAR